MMNKNVRLCAMLLASVLVLGACGQAGEDSLQDTSTDTEVSETKESEDNGGTYEITGLVGEPTDYSDDSNWMFHDDSAEHDVDLFYIYPTVVDDEEKPDIADINDESMRQWAKLAFVKSGRPFSDYTNVYAPFYRQTNLKKAMELTAKEYEEYNMQEQRTDIYAALDYYFENCNNGRPFILAGHSQGACMIKIVLSDYMRTHPEYLDRMVAAYVMGFSVTEDWLADNPHIRFAEGETDTGVVISWNTEGPDNSGTNLVIHENAISINPINWKRDDTPAAVEENRGSLIIDTENMTSEVGEGIADATINLERGTVVCTTCTEYEAYKNLFGNQGLHGHDCDLYYENIRENGLMRIASYFGKLEQYENEQVKVISHRGANAYAPENTMSAFLKAYELGADGFETDVQLTKDGELVICHNYSIDGLSDGKGLIRDLTLEELKQYDFGVTYGDGTEFAGERISTLAEVLDECKDFDILNIELKAPVERDDTYITKVADTIRDSGVMDKVIVSGFDHSLLKELKEYNPDIRVGTLILPNFTGALSFDVADCIPGDKVLTDLTVDDIVLPDDVDRNEILSMGVEADSAEEVVLELCHQLGAMYTGSNWAECSEQISLQADLTQYIDSLEFKPDYAHPYYATIIRHPEVIDEMHSRGIGVNVWTTNDEEILKAVYSLGVDGVITDAPDLALELLDIR